MKGGNNNMLKTMAIALMPYFLLPGDSHLKFSELSPGHVPHGHRFMPTRSQKKTENIESSL